MRFVFSLPSEFIKYFCMHLSKSFNFKLFTHRVFAGILLVALILVLALDVGMKAPDNLKSLIGMAVYIGLFYIFSKHPSKVRLSLRMCKNDLHFNYRSL